MAEVGNVNLAAYLASKQVTTYRASGSEITTHCWFCSDGNGKGKGKLYLNTDSWLWDCKRCSTKGNRRSLLREFGDTDVVQYVVSEDPSLRRRVITRAVELGAEGLLNNETQLEYLLGRGLTFETIETHQIGYVGKNSSLCRSITLPGHETIPASVFVASGLMSDTGQDWLDGRITIPYYNHGTVVTVRAKDPKAKYFTARGDDVRLYNSDALADADEVIITEGEFDCLILQQTLREAETAGRKVPAVVGIPGAESWPTHFETYFSDIKRVFIALDPDEAGRQATEKLIELLGPKACAVELPMAMPKCDWTEYLRRKTETAPHGGHTWVDVVKLIDMARMLNKRLLSIVDIAMKWENARSRGAGVTFGYSEFDSVVGGVQPGQVVIPLAKAGTGKTVLLANVMHNTCHRRVMTISLEMQGSEIFNLMRRIHFFHNPMATADDMFEDYKRMRIFEENKLTADGAKRLIDEYAEDVGDPPELIIVDYLGYFARGFRGDSYARTGDAVMALKEIAKMADCPILSPHQVNRGADEGKPLALEDARDSGVVEETADFVIGMYRPERAIDSEQADKGSLRMGLLKSRHGHTGANFQFRLSNMSLAIVEERDRKAVNRVEQENAIYAMGTSYEEFRRQAGTRQLQLVVQ